MYFCCEWSPAGAAWLFIYKMGCTTKARSTLYTCIVLFVIYFRPLNVILANCEDQDNAAFHQGTCLQCLLRQNKNDLQRKKMQVFFTIIEIYNGPTHVYCMEPEGRIHLCIKGCKVCHSMYPINKFSENIVSILNILILPNRLKEWTDIWHGTSGYREGFI